MIWRCVNYPHCHGAVWTGFNEDITCPDKYKERFICEDAGLESIRRIDADVLG